MADQHDGPFNCIEEAHQYIGLLRDAADETQVEVRDDLAAAEMAGARRRVEALYVVMQKLGQLRQHLDATRRVLNDLRTLRRLLFEERDGVGDQAHDTPSATVPPPA
jgi:hypothetical protein